MDPIAALMLSRSIQQERRRVSPRRRWLNEVQDAHAERRAPRIETLRVFGVLRPAGSAE